jgi:hypothetical protein
LNRVCVAARLNDPTHAARTCQVDCIVVSRRWTVGTKEDKRKDEGIEEGDSSDPEESVKANIVLTEYTSSDPHEAARGSRQFNILSVDRVRDDGIYEGRDCLMSTAQCDT